jgi:hypothetical protein
MGRKLRLPDPVNAMNPYTRDDAASRAGVERDYLDRLIDLGVELKGVAGAVHLHAAHRSA